MSTEGCLDQVRSRNASCIGEGIMGLETSSTPGVPWRGVSYSCFEPACPPPPSGHPDQTGTTVMHPTLYWVGFAAVAGKRVNQSSRRLMFAIALILGVLLVLLRPRLFPSLPPPLLCATRHVTGNPDIWSGLNSTPVAHGRGRHQERVPWEE